MEKTNITPGPYIIVDQSLYSKATGECICQTYRHSNDNKEFVGEAFNVFHESGLTPRELLTCLKDILSAEDFGDFSDDYSNFWEKLEEVRKLLKQSETK